jgi:hypothetical protein
MVVRNSAELVFDEVLVEEKELDLTQLTVGQSAHFVMGPKDLQEQAKITMAFTDNHGSIDLYFHEQESKPGFFEARSMKVAAGADLNVRETDPDLDIDSEHWPTVNLRYAEVEGNGTVLIPRRLVDGGVVSWDPKPDVPPEADVRIWS